MKKAMNLLRRGALTTIAVALWLSIATAQTTTPPVQDPILTQALQPILTPVTKTITGLTSLLTRSRDMKLLVISADGTDPSYAALQAILDQMGVPYDAVVLTQTGGKLPKLEGFLKGNYQGIILSTGNLVTCSAGPCVIALPDAGWKALDQYAVQYGVRTVAYYTFPDPRYGLAWNGSAVQAGDATFLPASADVFPDLKRAAPMPIKDSYVYGATTVSGAGETTTPILTMNGVIGAIHKKADNREYLALTFDNNPYQLHSLAFGYGIVNWVTKGIFIGERKYYYTPQIDDLFLSSDLFNAGDPNCRPSGFQVDPTVDPTLNCASIRTTGADLNVIKSWQDAASAGGPGNIKVTMAFNGFGTTAMGEAPVPDTLASSASQHRSDFVWITHTYDHENLDCFLPVPNSGVCKNATYSQSSSELTLNDNIGRQLNLVQDRASIVTPNLSGLTNPSFMQAAKDFGIKYTVMDSSKLPPNFPHNNGIKNQYQPSILMIPRRPTNIFYNVSNPYNGTIGSATDEYNYFYGPNGISRIGGPGGPPFFTTEQSYPEIIDREADMIVKNMLRGEVFGYMFHQANLVAYDGQHTLFTDLSSAVLAKFRGIHGSPVNSLTESDMAAVVNNRMGFDAAAVSATLNPGVSISLSSSKSAKVPVTGLCRSACDSTGARPISYFNTSVLLPTLVLLP